VCFKRVECGTVIPAFAMMKPLQNIELDEAGERLY
jgi:hypothetical protein